MRFVFLKSRDQKREHVLILRTREALRAPHMGAYNMTDFLIHREPTDCGAAIFPYNRHGLARPASIRCALGNSTLLFFWGTIHL